MITCPNCGKSLPPYALKCKYCDTRIESIREIAIKELRKIEEKKEFARTLPVLLNGPG